MGEDDKKVVFSTSDLRDQGITESPFPTLREFNEQWKLKILFVKADFAQIGDIVLEPWTYSDPTIVSAIATSAKKELEKIGLVVKSFQDPQNNWRIWFAKSNKILVQISEEQNDDRSGGEMYGIPQTARQAYPNVMPDSELPKDIIGNPLFTAIPFMPSRGNFRAEWQEFVQKATDIQRTMPELVQQLDLGKLFGAT